MNTIPKKPNLDWLKYFKKYIYYKHGNLYSLNLRSSAGKNKTPIGRINSSGYYTIVFERNRGNYICIKNHHLIWFLNTGEWPSNEIDHINRDKLDNRIENLELWNTMQPSGQRIEDKIEYALTILQFYAPEKLVK